MSLGSVVRAAPKSRIFSRATPGVGLGPAKEFSFPLPRWLDGVADVSAETPDGGDAGPQSLGAASTFGAEREHQIVTTWGSTAGPASGQSGHLHSSAVDG
jgi:hypothetical protein